MKKFYLIATVAFLAFSSCKKQEERQDVTTDDSMIVEDSTSIPQDGVVVDSTTIDASVTDSSDVELLDKMSTKTTTTSTDPSKGKYALSETKWKLVELNGKAVKSNSGKDYFINLDSKSGKFAAYAGCNNFAGTFVMKATTKLAFSKIMGTKMACPNMNFESDFIKALEKVDNYMIEGNSLHFHRAKMATLAKFEVVK